jgi:hypothetical protein
VRSNSSIETGLLLNSLLATPSNNALLPEYNMADVLHVLGPEASMAVEIARNWRN